MALNKAIVTPRTPPILHLNLRPFFVLGLWVILFSAPFFRGLFFPPELLTAHILVGVVFALCVYEGKKDKNDNVISRTWEAAKESLGLGAWTERQESEAEKKR